MYSFNVGLFEKFLKSEIVVDLRGEPDLEDEFFNILDCRIPKYEVGSDISRMSHKLVVLNRTQDYVITKTEEWYKECLPMFPIVPVDQIIVLEELSCIALENDVLLATLMS